jgi:hypothetical protein
VALVGESVAAASGCLEFLAQQIEEFRNEQREMRSGIDNMAADLKVLTGIVLELTRDMAQMKDILARIDARSSPSW